jgi:hypothetical protein
MSHSGSGLLLCVSAIGGPLVGYGTGVISCALLQVKNDPPVGDAAATSSFSRKVPETRTGASRKSRVIPLAPTRETPGPTGAN